MSVFDQTEKMLLSEALQVYLQVMQQQISPKEFPKLIQVAKKIMEKIESAGSAPLASGAPPPGISQEHFKNVCQECPGLDHDGSCTNSITKKFPGKCDPILKYERAKALS